MVEEVRGVYGEGGKVADHKGLWTFIKNFGHDLI